MMARLRLAGKKQSNARSKPVFLSCPDCAGVLAVAEEGKHAHHTYVCQVGHRYSTRSLIDSKEESLERTLWSVGALLVHVQILYEEMQRELRIRDRAIRTKLQRRVLEASQQQHIIEDVFRCTNAWNS